MDVKERERRMSQEMVPSCYPSFLAERFPKEQEHYESVLSDLIDAVPSNIETFVALFPTNRIGPRSPPK
jgi:hypothetical protein